MQNFKHLEALNLTYVQHFTQAAGIFLQLQKSALKLLVHAVYPDLYPHCVQEFVDFYVKTKQS